MFGRFAVAFADSPGIEGLPCGPRGNERAEFRIAANAGEAPRALAKVVPRRQKAAAAYLYENLTATARHLESIWKKGR